MSTGRESLFSTLREGYRRQKGPLWFGFSRRGFAAFLRLHDGGLHFGLRLTSDSVMYGNAPERQYGIALWWRRNRKGKRGEPHAVTIKVFAS